MSRFFHGGLSDSETSSSEEEELYSESEEEGSEAGGEESSSEEESEDEAEEESDSEAEGGDYFGKGGAASDSDEEEVRVVKSAKDKRQEEIEAAIGSIRNAQKINDWVVIMNEFDKLNKLVVKVLQSAGARTPKVYIKVASDLEDFMNETVKDRIATKTMSNTNARAMNAMKQKIKRNNRDYAQDIEAYRADKEEFMKEDIITEKIKKPTPTNDFIRQEAEEEGDAGEWQGVGRGGKTLTYTPESIFRHLKVIIESRGKKNTDRQEQIRVMEKLHDVSQTPYQKIKVLLALVSTRFDLTTGATSYMPTEQWNAAEKEFKILLGVLENTKEFVVVETAEEWDDEDKPPQPAEGEVFRVPGSIVGIADRLDDELTRSLQAVDPHTTEYIERLRDEGALYSSILRGQLYLERLHWQENISMDEALNRIITRRLEHMYFKPAQVITLNETNAWNSIPESLESRISPRSTASKPAGDLIQILCSHLYQHDATVLRTRAILYHIYHIALHDDFYKARDWMLMAHLQENIHAADVSTQILYNRTLVNIGLSAFRAGLIYEAQTALQEICGTGRLKELLAQGVQMQRYSQVTPEQERLERQRQLPFHMHINLELLECGYLTCSMLLEIPNLAATGSSPDLKKRVISKTFRRMLEYHERQIFAGPPENTRDHVMQAAKALAAGEWKKCIELIHTIKIWELMPEPEGIKILLAEKIQEEGLRTYLFTYAPFYDTLAIDKLAEMFELPQRKVTALVSKMIAHEEVAAALDQVNNAIIFRKGVELSRLQTLALTLSDKASMLIEKNEQTLEQKTQGGAGGEGGERTRGQGGRGRGGRGRGRGRGGGGEGRNITIQQQSGFRGGAMKT